MNNGPSTKRRCPARNADCTDKTTCHRYGADPGPLVRLTEQAGHLHARALTACRTGDYDTILQCARQAAAICFSPETARVLFCAAVLVGRFDLDLSVRDKVMRQDLSYLS